LEQDNWLNGVPRNREIGRRGLVWLRDIELWFVASLQDSNGTLEKTPLTLRVRQVSDDEFGCAQIHATWTRGFADACVCPVNRFIEAYDLKGIRTSDGSAVLAFAVEFERSPMDDLMSARYIGGHCKTCGLKLLKLKESY